MKKLKYPRPFEPAPIFLLYDQKTLKRGRYQTLDGPTRASWQLHHVPAHRQVNFTWALRRLQAFEHLLTFQSSRSVHVLECSDTTSSQTFILTLIRVYFTELAWTIPTFGQDYMLPNTSHTYRRLHLWPSHCAHFVEELFVSSRSVISSWGKHRNLNSNNVWFN